MATHNLYKKFKSLVGEKYQYRAEVLEVDVTNNRVRVIYTGFNEWVTGSATVGDFILVEDGVMLSVIPPLPYLETEI